MDTDPLPENTDPDPAPDPAGIGIYDRDRAGADLAADLWFLPSYDVGHDPGHDLGHDLAPLPHADRRPLIAPADWVAAQASLSVDLAQVTGLFGMLHERLRAGPEGWGHRLALLEAAELSWWAGDRIGAERLALWDALRLTGPQADSQSLLRAAWALRRLSGGPGPEPEAQTDTGTTRLADFFGRHGPEAAAPEGVEDLAALSASLSALHPVTRSAALFYGWRILAADPQGQSGATRDIEAAVLAARVGGETARNMVGAAMAGGPGALFLPLALSGFAPRRDGPVRDRLAVWLRGAAQATQAALLHLDRLAAWSVRAGAALADQQGRTPALLIKVLAAWPMVTAPVAEKLTGAGQATVQRNLARMQARGLIREVTGQGRYRVWTAKL